MGSGVSAVKKRNRSERGFSIASFILSLVPALIVFLGFFLALFFTPWTIVYMMLIITPTMIIASVLSIILGIIGLTKSKSAFAWVGIIFAAVQFLIAMWLL